MYHNRYIKYSLMYVGYESLMYIGYECAIIGTLNIH